MLMQLTDSCLYSDRDMSCHGVSIVCCTKSRCSVCSRLCPQIQKSSASAPTIAPHYPPVPFHLVQPLLKMSLHLFLGDHPFKILLKPCSSVMRHLPSVQEHLASVALLLSINWKATLFPIALPFRHRQHLKRI